MPKIERAILKNGEDFILNLQLHSWSFLDTSGRDSDLADGILMGLLNLGYSEIEIRNIIKVGGYRLQRLRNRMAKGAEFLAPVQKLASHAFHKDTIEFLKSEIESWEPHLEYEFPCPHRRMKSYFVEEGVTWRSIHEEYEDSWSSYIDR